MPKEVIRIAKPAARPKAASREPEPAAIAESTGKAPDAPRPASIDASRRRALIAEAAYYRSLRHTQPGREVEDWLAAEQEVDSSLMARHAQ